MHAGREYWDGYFARLRDAGDDLDWGGRWTEPFLPVLRAAGAAAVLELGCGTGNDAARLVEAGFEVTGLDLSAEALAAARRKAPDATFVVADMATRLPFADASFDAVMANVSLHMFPADVTRRVFAEVERVVRPRGVFLFHVNAREDRPLRARRRPVVAELEPNYVLEEVGQAVRFFSEGELRSLLSSWAAVTLARIEIRAAERDRPFKVVWRGLARGRRPT